MRSLPKLSAVVLAGAVLATACSESTSGSGQLGGPIVTVVCRAASGDVAQDKAALTRRLDTLGADTASIVTRGATVTMKVRGVTKAQVGSICTSSTLAMRPLVAPEAGACAAPDRTAAPSATVQACDPDGRRYRFGPAIVSGPDFTDARVTAPNAGGSSQWAITVTLSSSARARFGAFTAAHNSGGVSTATAAQECGAATVPCADYLGILVDGRAVSIPVTESPITAGTIQISGNFTRRSARQLATQLKSGRLPVPLELVSVK